ncbi:sigma-70 family RNA polymerase sigma factor [Clostridiaceae bacterium NSJ-31]|uniref:Sigma-70 family RNA polymerase sigma factor n=1 Tax=Ligaoa zhengdingensis TaxID=2763658 RepID=A0A926DYR7_9FIRM|nr:sigma-70 family RNA polymerase sigma factor [Ligaoa zhengdingensis]MBC8547720.1 sigma-70 family RNA polymerase sigma factor [Ligaoa zhengdingensis]
MSMNMFAVAGDCPGNEELALQIQAGDKNAAELLISQNEGYITELALKHSEWCDLEDLKQEGAMALLEAAKRFDPSRGTKLLTYATPAMESAMLDYGAHDSLTISIPPSRYHQLRRVAHVCAEAQDEPEPALMDAVCKELAVSQKVAAELLKEYRTLFGIRLLGDDVFAISCSGDPARAYDRYMRRVFLHQLMEEVLNPRELNLVRCYLGIGQPDEEGMTFQELAIRLNYNGPSGAEKAYKTALRKLKKELYSGAYGQWLEIQKAINKARAEAEADSGYYTTPQTTWLDDKNLAERFICEVVSLIRIHEIFSDALDEEQK